MTELPLRQPRQTNPPGSIIVSFPNPFLRVHEDRAFQLVHSALTVEENSHAAVMSVVFKVAVPVGSRVSGLPRDSSLAYVHRANVFKGQIRVDVQRHIRAIGPVARKDQRQARRT